MIIHFTFYPFYRIHLIIKRWIDFFKISNSFYLFIYILHLLIIVHVGSYIHFICKVYFENIFYFKLFISIEPPDGITPTVGFSNAKLLEEKWNITLYDVGGGTSVRTVWKKYYAEVITLSCYFLEAFQLPVL